MEDSLSDLDHNSKIIEQLRKINGSGSPRPPHESTSSIGELGSLPHHLTMNPSKRKGGSSGLKNLPLSPHTESSNVILINDESVHGSSEHNKKRKIKSKNQGLCRGDTFSDPMKVQIPFKKI